MIEREIEFPEEANDEAAKPERIKLAAETVVMNEGFEALFAKAGEGREHLAITMLTQTNSKTNWGKSPKRTSVDKEDYR